MSIRVLIVDDHAVVRQGLRTFLRIDPDIEVVGEASDGAEGVRLAQELEPDIVVMDLVLPGLDGISATRAIKKSNPDIEVLVLTSVLDQASVVGAVQAGAIGYHLKDTGPEDLARAIKAAADGVAQLTPRAARLLMTTVSSPADPEPLTGRERSVLLHLSRGFSNKEIAQQLTISEGTVKTHVRSILAKLQLESRTQAALYAVRSIAS